MSDLINCERCKWRNTARCPFFNSIIGEPLLTAICDSYEKEQK